MRYRVVMMKVMEMKTTHKFEINCKKKDLIFYTNVFSVEDGIVRFRHQKKSYLVPVSSISFILDLTSKTKERESMHEVHLKDGTLIYAWTVYRSKWQSLLEIIAITGSRYYVPIGSLLYSEVQP